MTLPVKQEKGRGSKVKHQKQHVPVMLRVQEFLEPSFFSFFFFGPYFFVLFVLYKKGSQYKGIKKGRTRDIPLGIRTQDKDKPQKGGRGMSLRQ